MWARFETLEAFNIWHAQIKEQLGIPLPDGISTEYTNAQLTPDGSYSAWVEPKYFDGLIEGLQPISKRLQQSTIFQDLQALG